MTVRELIDLLGDFDEDADVRIAYQPSWPLAAEVANVTSSEEAELLSDDEAMEVAAPDPPNVVWIAATSGVGRHDENPYAPSGAWGS
jgi:hypothetical protein